MSDNGYRCGHPACECTVMDSGGWCSEHCEKATSESGPCECGHELCEHRQKREAQADDPSYAGPT